MTLTKFTQKKPVMLWHLVWSVPPQDSSRTSRQISASRCMARG